MRMFFNDNSITELQRKKIAKLPTSGGTWFAVKDINGIYIAPSKEDTGYSIQSWRLPPQFIVL